MKEQPIKGWVKASELPDNSGKYICRLIATKGITTLIYFAGEFETSYPLDTFEYLDETPVQSGEERLFNKLEIVFKDCWEFDKRLPKSDRWLAEMPSLPGMIVAASTKEKAFEEMMISLKVKVAYDSNYDLKNNL